MKKTSVRSIAVLGIVLIAFLILSWAIPFQRTATFWVGFVFGIIGILAAALGMAAAFKKGGDARSKFYGFPIARIAVIYLVIQIIVSFILMGLSFIAPFWIGLIVCVLILLGALLGFVAADVARDEIERQDAQLKQDVSAMRALQSKINVLVNNCEDAEVKTVIQKLARDFRYSDPVSSLDTAEIEEQLGILLAEVEDALLEGDKEGTIELAKKLSGTLQERNRICKLAK